MIVNSSQPPTAMVARERANVDQPEAPANPANQASRTQTTERPVDEVNAPEAMPDEQRMDVSQARDAFAREGGQRTPENPISGPEEAMNVASSVRDSLSRDGAQAMATQTGNLPEDVTGLLSPA